jgi:hypothetical protein
MLLRPCSIKGIVYRLGRFSKLLGGNNLEAVLEAITKAVIKRPEDGPLGGRYNCNDWAEAMRKPRRGLGEGPSLKGPEASMS